MAAASRTKAKAAKIEDDREFEALPEDDESTAEEIHALIEREKDNFISLEEYCKRRGIDW